MKRIATCLLLISMVLFSFIGCGDSDKHEGEAKTPSGSKAQKGRHYEDVIVDFKEKGFVNIQTDAIDDLITGWTTKEGEVESVSVDGDLEYSADVWYPNDVEVIITYHSFPEKDNSISQSGTSSTSETSPEPKKDILTIANNEDLAAVLLAEGDADSLYLEFAEKYKGSEIKFDGHIDYLVNHDNYKTRYDVLLSFGDWINEETVSTGPVFKFEDVGVTALGIEDLYLPEFVSVGSNVHIIAKVKEYNPNTGMFMLSPVSITER